MTKEAVSSIADPDEVVANQLVQSLVDYMNQGTLFIYDSLVERYRHDLRFENPDKLVVSGKLMDEYRYTAAILGAGLELDDPRLKSSNDRMWEEITDPSNGVHTITKKYVYDHVAQAYVISKKQLRKIFRFDFTYLAGLCELGFDLFYEGEE